MMPINESLAIFLFGELPSKALKERRCVQCKKPITDSDFRDETSRKEYYITAFCQACRDEVFESED
jgi:hypothetical protein